MEQVTGVRACFIVSVSKKLCVCPPKLNENVRSNFVGWNTFVDPMT
jgi:hypothetical protein